MHHVYSQLKADIDCQRSNKENELSPDADSEAGLRACDLQELFVKHAGGDTVFFCDLGMCVCVLFLFQVERFVAVSLFTMS